MAQALSSSALELPFPLAGLRVRVEGEGEAAGTITRLADGETVGHVAFEVRASELILRELCIEPGHRSYGCGSEAGWLMITAAEAAGFEVLRAWAAPKLGLSVYFWFRLGLHPLLGEGPDGGIWLERRLGR